MMCKETISYYLHCYIILFTLETAKFIRLRIACRQWSYISLGSFVCTITCKQGGNIFRERGREREREGERGRGREREREGERGRERKRERKREGERGREREREEEREGERGREREREREEERGIYIYKHLLLHVRVHTRRPRDTAIVYMLSYCMAQINWLSLGLE